MECPVCKKPMENFGNVSGLQYMTNPPQWDEVFACHDCCITKKKRVRGRVFPKFDKLVGYEEFKA